MSGVAKAIGGVAKGLGKAVGGVFKAAKNFVSTDAFKLAAIGAGIFFGGAAMGAWPLPSFLSGQPGAAAGVGTVLSQTTGIASAPAGPVSAALTAATTNPLLMTTMASPVTAAPMMSPIVAGTAGQTALLGGAGADLLPAASEAVTAPSVAVQTASAVPQAPKVSPFWTHPATRISGALLAGMMISKGAEERDKQRYKHERDLQRERLEARQIGYNRGSVRPSRLYRAVIG